MKNKLIDDMLNIHIPITERDGQMGYTEFDHAEIKYFLKSQLENPESDKGFLMKNIMSIGRGHYNPSQINKLIDEFVSLKM